MEDKKVGGDNQLKGSCLARPPNEFQPGQVLGRGGAWGTLTHSLAGLLVMPQEVLQDTRGVKGKKVVFIKEQDNGHE